MKGLQSTVIFAVIASNIHWRWTPNPYVAVLAGLMAASAVTWLLVRVEDGLRRL